MLVRYGGFLIEASAEEGRDAGAVVPTLPGETVGTVESTGGWLDGRVDELKQVAWLRARALAGCVGAVSAPREDTGCSELVAGAAGAVVTGASSARDKASPDPEHSSTHNMQSTAA